MIPQHGPEHTIDKTGQMLQARMLYQFNRLIYHGARRDPVHPEQLGHADHQHPADKRIHPGAWCP